ncbi:MAG: HAD family hydrolase [Malacoplasma sp.]|nr:HAD family hydrolase [Malacoplasma sp.]
MNKNYKFKHIFSDLDGTLTDSINNRPWFDKNLIKKINELNNFNIGFSIATGRHCKDVITLLNQNKITNIDYIIGIAGAQIYDWKNKVFLWNKFFDDKQEKVFDQIYDYLKQNHHNQFSMIIYSHNDGIADSMNLISDSQFFDENIGKWIHRMNTNTQYLDLYICRKLTYQKIHKVGIKIHKDLENSEQIFEKIKQDLTNKFGEWFDFIKCSTCYLEICMKQYTKGSAIEFLINEKIKLDYENLICFGDSDNDLAMFELIKNSVTRNSSPQEIKNKAKYVIDAKPSTFVLDGINDIVLNK